MEQRSGARTLTKRVVDAVKATDRDIYLWDADVSGLIVRCRVGGAKVYVLRYPTGRRGRFRQVTIGRHGSPWTVETARSEARRLLGLVAAGKDPAAEHLAGKRTPTIEEFSRRYLAEHAEPHLRPSSVQEARGHLRRVIVPRLGRVRIDKASRADVSALHHSRRETPTDANRSLALLSKMFSLAESYGLRAPASNPCRGIKRYKESKRERFLSEAELARLGAVLAQAETDGSEPVFAVAALRLLVLTGARRGEILGARWSDVDFEGGVLRVSLPKEGKPKLIRLGPPALSTLASLPRIEGNPFVVVGRVHGSGFVGLQDVWERIRVKAGLEDVRIHDLRHAFASVAAASGASLPIIGALLGHTQAATTQRYAHLSDDPLRSVADTTSERIAAALRRDSEQPTLAVLKMGRV